MLKKKSGEPHGPWPVASIGLPGDPGLSSGPFSPNQPQLSTHWWHWVMSADGQGSVPLGAASAVCYLTPVASRIEPLAHQLVMMPSWYKMIDRWVDLSTMGQNGTPTPGLWATTMLDEREAKRFALEIHEK